MINLINLIIKYKYKLHYNKIKNNKIIERINIDVGLNLKKNV